MRVLDLDGNAYERGYAQGAAIKEGFAALHNDFFTSGMVREGKPWFVPMPAVRGIIDYWGYNLTRPAVKKYLPAQYQRVNGLARGLGVSRHRAWGVHYVELMLCISTQSIDIPEQIGCTQAHATPSATESGSPLSARNYDFPNLLQKYQIIRREIPSEPGRLASTSVTQMPLAGAHHGINERGLMLCANNNRAWKEYDKRGVPYLFLLQEALETCSTTAEAVEFFTNFPARANCGFFGVMDKTGECRVVEFTAARTAVRKPGETGVLAQANHFIAMPDANVPDEATWNVQGMKGIRYSASTNARHAAADRRLHQAAGKITIATLMDILRDHSADPTGKGDFNSVCCHGSAGSTLCGIVADIAQKTLYVADGFPCAAEFEKVDFRSR